MHALTLRDAAKLVEFGRAGVVVEIAGDPQMLSLDTGAVLSDTPIKNLWEPASPAIPVNWSRARWT